MTHALSLFLLQAITDTAPSLSTLGLGGAIAGLVLILWRQDRKDSQERYERIASDFRVIVQDNTKAITALAEKMGAFSDNNAVTVRLLVDAMRQGKVINIEPDLPGATRAH